MNTAALRSATLVGTGLQVAMTVAGHFVPAVAAGFAFGGMGFSALAGWLFARRGSTGWGDAIGGGAIAGGVCAVIGIAVSVLLHDVPPSLLLLGTSASVVTGMIGGAIARVGRR